MPKSTGYKKKGGFKKADKPFQLDAFTLEMLTNRLGQLCHFSPEYDHLEQPKVFTSLLNSTANECIAKSTSAAQCQAYFDKVIAGVAEVDWSKIRADLDVLNVLTQDMSKAYQSKYAARLDVYDTIHNALYNDDFDENRPGNWLCEPLYAEKFMPFYESRKRYIYDGSQNQMGICFESDKNDNDHTMVMVTKSEIEQLVGETFKFDPTSSVSESDQKKAHFFAAMKGQKSLTSIFVPKQSSTYSFANGKPYTDAEGKRTKPTPQEIEEKHLKEFSSTYFILAPVWCVSQFKEHLSENALAAFNKLLVVREPGFAKNARTFNEHADLAEIVEDRINAMLDGMKLKRTDTNVGACYYPGRDDICVPQKLRFINPFARFRTSMHEIAHSTTHLLERDITLSKYIPQAEQPVYYAREEIIAETCARLQMDAFYQQLKRQMGGSLPDSWTEQYRDMGEYNKMYLHHYIDQAALAANFNQFNSGPGENRSAIEYIVNGVIKAQQLMTNMTLQGREITPELRSTAMKDNYARCIAKYEKLFGPYPNLQPNKREALLQKKEQTSEPSL